MNDSEYKFKFTPRFLGNGFFPYDLNILKNSRISIQYVYFAMFALWNEFEFLKIKELMKFSVSGKAISDKKIKRLQKGESKISDEMNPLLIKLGQIIKEKTEYLKSIKSKVTVDTRDVIMYTTKPEGGGFYIPFSGDIFGPMYIRDMQFCDIFQIGRSSLSRARERLKELHLIDYDSGGFLGKKMTWFTFIPPIKKWIGIPLNVFYIKDLSRSSKVILFWLNKYLIDTDVKEVSRKDFMRFSGFKSEKTLRSLRKELIPIFPYSKDLLKTLL